jgi:hypothetical protein
MVVIANYISKETSMLRVECESAIRIVTTPLHRILSVRNR